MIRQGGIAKGEAVAIVQQCALAGVSRATVYAQHKARPVDESDLQLCRLIDEEFTRHPGRVATNNTVRRIPVLQGGDDVN